MTLILGGVHPKRNLPTPASHGRMVTIEKGVLLRVTEHPRKGFNFSVVVVAASGKRD